MEETARVVVEWKSWIHGVVEWWSGEVRSTGSEKQSRGEEEEAASELSTLQENFDEKD